MPALLTSHELKNKMSVMTSAVPLLYGSGNSDPTTSEIEAGKAIVWKNNTNGEIRLWVNDGGTMKKSAALTE